MRRIKIGLIVLFLATLVGVSLIGAQKYFTARAQTSKVNFVPITSGDYKIDPMHSTIGFAIRHYEINWVNGVFHNFSGVIHFDQANVTRSSVEFTAKIDSIDTGVAPRNNHLKTADFFDAEKFPEMSFKSTKVEKKGKDAYLVYGDLTMKGVTKAISFPFTLAGALKDAQGNTRFGVEAKTKIDRRDYGITYGKPMAIGGFDIGNEVTITLNLEAVQAAPKPAAQ